MDSSPRAVLVDVDTAAEAAAPGGRGSRASGVAMLIAASVLWSLSGVVVKVVQIPPGAFAFWRSLGAAAIMAALLPLGRGRLPPLPWMLASATLYTVVVSLLITSMTASTAATGILLQYTAPLFCALFAWAFLRRRISAGTMVAMSVAAVGIAIMVVGGWKGENWVGPVTGLVSGAAFGALILVLEKIDRAAGPGGANPFAIVLFNNAGAAAILLPLSWWQGALPAAPWKIGLVCATGVVQLAIPYVLFQLALRRVRPVDASLLILLEPVLNPVWVALATNERPDAFTLAGGAAILAAMVVEAVKPANEERPAPPGFDPVLSDPPGR
jgi:drug/metabolite transporter (DMT)-like permease